MPIYEYQCQACQHRLEVLQKIADEPLSLCPACKETGLKKLVSAAAFRLKGGGWYETDFKTGNKKNLSSDAGGNSSADSGEKGTVKTGKSDKTDKQASKAATSPAKTGSSTAAKDSS
jgi:putative FmdB family regulatory protein